MLPPYPKRLPWPSPIPSLITTLLLPCTRCANHSRLSLLILSKIGKPATFHICPQIIGCVCVHESLTHHSFIIVLCLLESEVEDLIARLWGVYKTLLFSMIMVLQSMLSSSLFKRKDSHSNLVKLSVSCLTVFRSLSFIISQVGGVSSKSPFSELKRCFYTAIDIVASNGELVNGLMRQICQEISGICQFSTS